MIGARTPGFFFDSIHTHSVYVQKRLFILAYVRDQTLFYLLSLLLALKIH